MKNIDPPKWASKFFSWICHQANLEGLEGDLYELFDKDVDEYGASRARRRYVLNVLTLMRPSVVRNILKTNNNMDTIYHYLKSIIRTSVRQKGFTAVSLIGLVLAFTTSILVLLYVSNELSYDEFRVKKNSVFRVYNIRHGNDGPPNYLPIVPPVFSTVLASNFPQIESSGRIMNDYGGSYFQIGETGFEDDGGIFAEVSIPDLLELEIIEGSLSGFEEPNTLLLSSGLFTKFYGDVDFNNQAVVVNGHEVKVIGIYKDIPLKSHLRPSYLFSLSTATQNVTEERMNSWVWQQFFTYVQLREGVDAQQFESEFQAYVEKVARPILKDNGFYYVPYLQPVTDIHLKSSQFNWEIAKRGNYQAVVFIGLAALIILIIALFNFINLFALQTIKKLREIGIRRTIGAFGNQIVSQLVLHSSAYIFLALLLSAGLGYVFLPFIELILEEQLNVDFLWNVKNLAMIGGIVFSLILICSIYPILIARRYKPSDTLKGIPRFGSRRLDPRIVMVGFQYLLSVGLIFSSLIIQKQFKLLSEKDMGFNPKQLLSIYVPAAVTQSAEATKIELSKYANIETISICYGTPGGIIAGDGVLVVDRESKEFTCNMIIADHDYIRTLGMEIIAGRDFNDGITDKRESFVINEIAVENFGFANAEDAIGKELEWPYWGTTDSLKKGKVIGVVRNFNFKSLHNAIQPMVLHIVPSYQNTLIVRIGEENIPETIAYLENWWNGIGSSRPLQYEFVDELFAREYRSEQTLNTLFLALTIVAIFMAAIGIITLVTYTINSRLKEISIRKVLGAGEITIFTILSRKYLVLSAISLLIALPIASYLLQKWLNEYAFRTEIDLLTYVFVGIATLLFTFISVGSQALSAAKNNPVDNLRSE